KQCDKTKTTVHARNRIIEGQDPGGHLKCCLPLLESLKFCLRSSGASLLGPVPTGAVDRDNSPPTFCPLGGGFKSVLLHDPKWMMRLRFRIRPFSVTVLGGCHTRPEVCTVVRLGELSKKVGHLVSIVAILVRLYGEPGVKL